MKKYLVRVLCFYLRRKFGKKVTYIGDGQRFSRKSKVYLADHALPKQIILFAHVDMYGKITAATDGVVEMHEYSKIGNGSEIQAVKKVVIGKYTAIGANTIITDNNTHPINPEYRKKMRMEPHGSDMRQWKHSVSAPVIIGENCWIGSNVRICKGITIGDNAVIAACSVVTKDVPANAIAAGNPAKIVKTDINLMD